MTYFEQKETDGKKLEESILAILNHPYNVEECGCTQQCSELYGAEVKGQVESSAECKSDTHDLQ